MENYYQTTLKLWVLLKPFHLHFYFQLFFIMAQQLTHIYAIYLSSVIINNIIEKNYDASYQAAVIVAVISLARYLVLYFTDKHQLKYMENGIHTFLQEYSLKKILNLNPSQYIEDHSAVKLIVINRGEEAVKMIISIFILTLIPTVSQVVFSIFAIAYFSPMIAILTCVTFVIASLWANYFAKYHKKFIKQNTENWDDFNKIRTESFQHLSLIKTSGVEDSYLKKYISSRFFAIDYDLFTWNKNNINNKARFSFFTISKMIITWQLIYQAAISKIVVGDIFAIWTWVNDAFNNIGNVVQATRKIPLHFVELDKYLNIIEKEPEFDESGSKKIASGDIIFKDVKFKYPKSDAPVIHNLNIKIPEGKKVAFVGFSGSGKSTIIKLLLRIYNWDNGDITIGGKSLREIDAKYLRQRIGYVEQHVDLFDLTIKENILFGVNEMGLKKFTNEALEIIIKKARINTFSHRLGRQGLDTIIGERGVKLSGGERQRIGIARALAKNPDILIFDEATASLDTENEKYIQEAIDESSKGRTTIIIAHRLSTVQNSDVIFVMDKGVVVGQGTHEELKDSSEIYQRLIYAKKN